MAVDGAGNLFIATPSDGLIRRVDAATRIITTYASGFSNPRSVAVDAAGNLYVAENGMVRKLDTSGKLTLIAQTQQPVCVRVDAAGNAYVADQGRNIVLQVNGQTQKVSVIAGNGGAGSGIDGVIATAAPLNAPSGIALDAAGNLYIADYSNAVRKTSPIASLTFPSTFVGEASAAQTISVANIGNQPLTFSGLTENTNSQQQIIDGVSCSASTVVAAGGSCTITLAFAPEASGIVNGNVVLTDNNRNTAGSSQAIPLSGTGVVGAVAQISVNPASLTFGAAAIGTQSATQTVTVTNTGAAPLNISSLRVEGPDAADFTLVSNTCTRVLAVNASCAISVSFTPTATGIRTAALMLVSNLANSPQIALTGTGGSPKAVLNASVLAFDNQPVSTLSAARTITISNTGSGVLNISAVALTATNPNDFRVISNGCGSSVAAGASCSITVGFLPTGLGLRSAMLDVTTNAPGTTQSVSLSGKGTVCASPAVWRPSSGAWYVIQPWSGTALATVWGEAGDIPVPGDYDGDGKTDIVVYRPLSSTWWIRSNRSGAGSVQAWGVQGDVPVPGDYDGDGKTDLAVYRPSNGNWYVLFSGTGSNSSRNWGMPGDIPIPGDYDGDGKTDFAVFRPSNGSWWVIWSRTGEGMMRIWGETGDVAIPADYDGDGKTDFAVYRPSSSTWWFISSRTGAGSVQA